VTRIHTAWDVFRPISTGFIGSSLKWHGSLSADYFYDESDGKAYYIDANPRITEPMNAAVNGINLADMQVRLSMMEYIMTSYDDDIVELRLQNGNIVTINSDAIAFVI
jgi:biotin carboxylase